MGKGKRERRGEREREEGRERLDRDGKKGKRRVERMTHGMEWKEKTHSKIGSNLNLQSNY